MTTSAANAYLDESRSWKSFKLDSRLSQAIDHLGFKTPTLVQSNVIPLAIDEKRDIIAKASTGSGKTAAYGIPIVQYLLSKIVDNDDEQEVNQIQSVILVPTRELSKQVHDFISSLLVYCNNKISLLNLSSNMSDQVLNSLLLNKPHILISTPAKLMSVLSKNANNPDLINLSNVKHLVVDEVDLILSYGYKDDLMALQEYLPIKKNLQVFLMSATINDELQNLKETFCTKPTILKLNDENFNQNNLVQYYCNTTEFDKFLLSYVIFKLNLIKGKSLVFVNNIDRGYRLKLFLEQFGIRCCILNSELPINSRLHIVDEFNKNVYNLLIATDETNEVNEIDDDDDENQAGNNNDNKEESSKSSKSSQKHKKDKEYGVSRGVDFKNVACVVNFDLPTTSKAYIHRIGRTARAGKSGMALSFVIPKKEFGKHKVACLSSSKKDERVLSRIIKQQSKYGFEIKPYQFNIKQVEGFRYRSEDAFRAVTQTAIREARIKELKQELMNSDKLKRFFEENPQDLQSLRHDKELHPSKVQSQLKRIPDYLLPETAREDPKKLGFVPFHKHKVHKKTHNKRKKKNDPLKSMKI